MVFECVLDANPIGEIVLFSLDNPNNRQFAIDTADFRLTGKWCVPNTWLNLDGAAVAGNSSVQQLPRNDTTDFIYDKNLFQNFQQSVGTGMKIYQWLVLRKLNVAGIKVFAQLDYPWQYVLSGA